MVQVPLPQEPFRVAPLNGFVAPRTEPFRDPTGAQIERGGRALQRFGLATGDVVKTLQDEFDEAVVKERMGLLDERIQEVLRDPDNGYLNTVGKDATGFGRAQAIGRIDQAASELAGSLESDLQRDMFRSVVAPTRRRVVALMDGHEGEQVRVYSAAQSRVARNSAARNYIESSVEPVTVPGELQGPLLETQTPPQGRRPDIPSPQTYWNTAIHEVHAEADAKRFPQDDPRREEMVRETKELMHTGVVERLVGDKRGVEAKAYLQGVPKDELAGPERTRLRRLVARASLNDEAFTRSTKLLREAQGNRQADPQVQGPPMPQVDRAQQDGIQSLQEIRAKLQQQFNEGKIDADLHDAILDRATDSIAFDLDLAAQEQNSLVRQAEQWLFENPGKGVRQLPAEMYQAVINSGKLQPLLRFVASGLQYPNDPDVLADFLAMGPDDLRKMTPAQFEAKFRDGMKNDTYARSFAAFADAKEPGKSPTAGLRTMLLRERYIEAGILDSRTGKIDEEEKRRMVGVEIRLAQLEDDFRRKHRRDPDHQEYKELLDQVFIVERFGDLPFSAQSPEEREDQTVTIFGFDVQLSDIPGMARWFAREDEASEFQVGDVAGLLAGELRENNRPRTDVALALEWLRHGRPQSIEQFRKGKAAIQGMTFPKDLPPGEALAQQMAAAETAIGQPRGIRFLGIPIRPTLMFRR